MADVADITDEREPSNMKMCLAVSIRPPGPTATGACLWCDEDLEADARWCDAGCRDDWEADQKRKGLQ